MSSLSNDPESTYDERAGCYIRFPSETDAIVASLALSQNCLNWQDLDRILRVITNPKFDPSKITLRSAADILQHAERSRIDEYAAKARTRSKTSVRKRQPLPLVILDEILELFHWERKNALDVSYGSPFQLKLLNDVEKGHTFAIMSLVHRSWTLPCQHALGRILHVTSIEKFLSKDRLKSSIYGSWTTSMIINAQTGPYDTLRPINLQDLEKFILRFSNLRSLWIKVDLWSSVWWLNDFYGEILKRNHRLQVLRLHGGDGVVPKVSLQPYFDNREHLTELHTLDVHDFSDADVMMVPHRPPSNLPLRHFTFFASGGLDDVRLASILPSGLDDGEGLKTFTLLDYGKRDSPNTTTFDAKRFATTWRTLNRLVLRSQELCLAQWVVSLLPHCSNLRELSFEDLTLLPNSSGVSYKTFPRSLVKIEFNFTTFGCAQELSGLPELIEFLATRPLTGLNLLSFGFAPLPAYNGYAAANSAETRRKQERDIEIALRSLTTICEDSCMSLRWIIRD